MKKSKGEYWKKMKGEEMLWKVKGNNIRVDRCQQKNQEQEKFRID